MYFYFVLSRLHKFNCLAKFIAANVLGAAAAAALMFRPPSHSTKVKETTELKSCSSSRSGNSPMLAAVILSVVVKFVVLSKKNNATKSKLLNQNSQQRNCGVVKVLFEFNASCMFHCNIVKDYAFCCWVISSCSS